MGRKQKTIELDREHDIAPGLVAKTKKRLVVARGSSHPELAAQVAELLRGIGVGQQQRERLGRGHEHVDAAGTGEALVARARVAPARLASSSLS